MACKLWIRTRIDRLRSAGKATKCTEARVSFVVHIRNMRKRTWADSSAPNGIFNLPAKFIRFVGLWLCYLFFGVSLSVFCVFSPCVFLSRAFARNCSLQSAINVQIIYRYPWYVCVCGHCHRQQPEFILASRDLMKFIRLSNELSDSQDSFADLLLEMWFAWNQCCNQLAAVRFASHKTAVIHLQRCKSGKLWTMAQLAPMAKCDFCRKALVWPGFSAFTISALSTQWALYTISKNVASDTNKWIQKNESAYRIEDGWTHLITDFLLIFQLIQQFHEVRRSHSN